VPDQSLRALAEEYWETLLEASPTTATILGDHRYDDRIEDLSAEAETALRHRWDSIRRRLATFAGDGLEADDRVTSGQLDAETTNAIAASTGGWPSSSRTR